MAMPESSYFKDETRDALLRAAMLCFVREGFGGVSMRQIAEQAKTSNQRLMYHFKKPEDMLAELARMCGESGRLVTMEHLASLIDAGPTEKIIGISDGMFIWIERFPNFARLTAAINEGVFKSKAIREYRRGTFDIGFNRVLELVHLCPKFKSTPPAKRQDVARGIFCLIHGAGHLVLHTDRFDDIEAYRASTAQAIRSLLEE